jgi:hypothetical protein
MSKDDVAVEISSVKRGFMNGGTKKANRLATLNAFRSCAAGLVLVAWAAFAAAQVRWRMPKGRRLPGRAGFQLPEPAIVIGTRCRESVSTQTTRAYVERKKKPRRPTDSVRFTLAQLSRFFGPFR